MRYVIGADYHINEKNRLEDFVRNLQEIEQHTHKKKVDVYAVAGDIFDKKVPTVKELLTFAEHLKNIRAEKIYLLRGNHVKIAKLFSALDIFAYDKRVTIGDNLEIGTPELSIFMTHATIAEAKIGNHNISLPGKSQSEYKKYNFVIAGHIHKPQFIENDEPKILVPGSIERVNFGERTDTFKYFYDLEIIGKNNCNIDALRLELRPMFEVVYDLDNKIKIVNDEELDPAQAVSVPDGAIVKLIVRGKKEQVKKINYDKLIAPFKKVYSLDTKLEYSNVARAEKSAAESANVSLTQEDIILKLKSYCKNNDLHDDVFKISEKIISK